MMRRLRLPLVLLAALFAGAPAGADTIAPFDPQPEAGRLKDGLAVNYYFAVFRGVEELVFYAQQNKPQPGPPISRLDYHVGLGKVLTSGKGDFVGAHIRGAIDLASAGHYEFEVTSNDGVRLVVGGQLLFIDPYVHSDSTSDPIPAEIEAPGWYPLEIYYFEKQSTSTLILKWKPPGASGFEVVPASALKHLP